MGVFLALQNFRLLTIRLLDTRVRYSYSMCLACVPDLHGSYIDAKMLYGLMGAQFLVEEMANNIIQN